MKLAPLLVLSLPITSVLGSPLALLAPRQTDSQVSTSDSPGTAGTSPQADSGDTTTPSSVTSTGADEPASGPPSSDTDNPKSGSDPEPASGDTDNPKSGSDPEPASGDTDNPKSESDPEPASGKGEGTGTGTTGIGIETGTGTQELPDGTCNGPGWKASQYDDPAKPDVKGTSDITCSRSTTYTRFKVGDIGTACVKGLPVTACQLVDGKLEGCQFAWPCAGGPTASNYGKEVCSSAASWTSDTSQCDSDALKAAKACYQAFQGHNIEIVSAGETVTTLKSWVTNMEKTCSAVTITGGTSEGPSGTNRDTKPGTGGSTGGTTGGTTGGKTSGTTGGGTSGTGGGTGGANGTGSGGLSGGTSGGNSGAAGGNNDAAAGAASAGGASVKSASTAGRTSTTSSSGGGIAAQPAAATAASSARTVFKSTPVSTSTNAAGDVLVSFSTYALVDGVSTFVPASLVPQVTTATSYGAKGPYVSVLVAYFSALALSAATLASL